MMKTWVAGPSLGIPSHLSRSWRWPYYATVASPIRSPGRSELVHEATHECGRKVEHQLEPRTMRMSSAVMEASYLLRLLMRPSGLDRLPRRTGMRHCIARVGAPPLPRSGWSFSHTLHMAVRGFSLVGLFACLLACTWARVVIKQAAFPATANLEIIELPPAGSGTLLSVTYPCRGTSAQLFIRLLADKTQFTMPPHGALLFSSRHFGDQFFFEHPHPYDETLYETRWDAIFFAHSDHPITPHACLRAMRDYHFLEWEKRTAKDTVEKTLQHGRTACGNAVLMVATLGLAPTFVPLREPYWPPHSTLLPLPSLLEPDGFSLPLCKLSFENEKDAYGLLRPFMTLHDDNLHLNCEISRVRGSEATSLELLQTPPGKSIFRLTRLREQSWRKESSEDFLVEMDLFNGPHAEVLMANNKGLHMNNDYGSRTLYLPLGTLLIMAYSQQSGAARACLMAYTVALEQTIYPSIKNLKALVDQIYFSTCRYVTLVFTEISDGEMTKEQWAVHRDLSAEELASHLSFTLQIYPHKILQHNQGVLQRNLEVLWTHANSANNDELPVINID